MNFLRNWNTIRLRLTLLYGGGFFIFGLVFIGVMYFQLNAVIGQQMLFRGVVVADTPGAPQQTIASYIRIGERENAGAPNNQPPLMREMEQRFETVRDAALRRIMLVSVVSLVAVGIIAAILGWLLAGRALQPLRQITATARGIADRNLHQRVGLQGPQDEIKDLADTLDGMLERLDRAFDSQQHFIANASHELRTPLAINRTLIEVAMLKEAQPDSALSQLGAHLLTVNQRHERLIDGLLMLASSEQQIADPQPLDLADVAREVLAESAGAARTARVELRADCRPAPCRGDPVLLERLLQNLVDNAIRYNVHDGGWLSLATGTDAQGRAVVTVENPGQRIAAYEVPRLFEPFRRLASTERQADVAGSLGRRGAGLGLSIVRSIVASHGGEVGAVARGEGGLCITVTLPPAKD